MYFSPDCAADLSFGSMQSPAETARRYSLTLSMKLGKRLAWTCQAKTTIGSMIWNRQFLKLQMPRIAHETASHCVVFRRFQDGELLPQDTKSLLLQCSRCLTEAARSTRFLPGQDRSPPLQPPSRHAHRLLSLEMAAHCSTPSPRYGADAWCVLMMLIIYRSVPKFS